MNILRIDTKDRFKTKVSLITDKGDFEKEEERKSFDLTLLLIEKLIAESGLQFADIDAIEVDPGPGSFTGVRIGVSVANALSFSLKKPVNEKEFGEIAYPQY